MAEFMSIELGGLTPRIEQFAAMQDRAADLRPVWDIAHEEFLLEQDKQFREQGSFLQDGQPWAPLSPSYVAEKKRKLTKLYGSETPPAPFGILYLTGDLYASMTNPDHEAHVKVTTPTDATFGSNNGPGRHHQKGAGNLPRRSIIVVKDFFKDFVFKQAALWIMKGQTHGGGG